MWLAAAVAVLLVELRVAPLAGWRANAAVATPLMQLRVAVEAVGGVGAADAAAVVVVV